MEIRNRVAHQPKQAAQLLETLACVVDCLEAAFGLIAHDLDGAVVLGFGDAHDLSRQILAWADAILHRWIPSGQPSVASTALVQAGSPVTSRPSQAGRGGVSPSDCISTSAITRPASVPSKTSISQA